VPGRILADARQPRNARRAGRAAGADLMRAAVLGPGPTAARGPGHAARTGID